MLFFSHDYAQSLSLQPVTTWIKENFGASSTRKDKSSCGRLSKRRTFLTRPPSLSPCHNQMNWQQETGRYEIILWDRYLEAQETEYWECAQIGLRRSNVETDIDWISFNFRSAHLLRTSQFLSLPLPLRSSLRYEGMQQSDLLPPAASMRAVVRALISDYKCKGREWADGTLRRSRVLKRYHAREKTLSSIMSVFSFWYIFCHHR